MEISVATSKLPRSPLLSQVSALLLKHKFGKVRVRFMPEVKKLGDCSGGVVTIAKVTATGVADTWRSYLSDDWMQQTVEARDVTVSDDECFLQFNAYRGEAWVTAYLNPSHTSSFAEFVPRCSADPQRFPRLAEILRVFEGRIAVARPEDLDNMDVSSEELAELVELGYLTCGKGKRPEVIDEPSARRGRDLSRTYRLNGARITREGETFVSWCSEAQGERL